MSDAPEAPDIRKRRKFNIRLAEGEKAVIRQMAAEDGLPVAMFIRRLAVEEWKRRRRE